MHIEGYDGWAGEFPFEVGDVCLTDEKDDIGILLYANYAYVYFAYLLSPPVGPMCTRIENVIDDYIKIGHVEESVVSTLLDLYKKQAQERLEEFRRRKHVE